MITLFKKEKFDGMLKIKIKLENSNRCEEIPAIIDSGFSGGLRLPKNLLGRVSAAKTDHKIFCMSKGEIDPMQYDLYSLWFQIVDRNGESVDVSSSQVHFQGKDYAVLGLHFIRKNHCLLAIDGPNQTFSFGFYNSDYVIAQKKSQKIHNIFA